MPDISSRKQWYERPKNVTVAKYRLTGSGLCMSSSSYSLYKYYVTAGEILYLYLNDVVVSSVSQNVYQFQSAESVPTSGTNSELIGSPVSGAVDAYVEVPEGATYLIVSQLTSSTNFKVCATLPDGGTISSVTPLDENTYEIKDKVARQTIPFGTTDFSSTSTAYTATVEGITELRSGVACYIMNTKVTSATGFTVNINGLGAKPVYLVSAAASRATTQFAVNYTWLLVYNENRVAGGCWDMSYLYNTDNNTIGYNIRNYSGSLTAKAAIYRYMVLLTVDENTVVPINSTSNSTATTKTLTTESFDPFGPIYYYSTTTTISAGSTIGASYRWTQYAVDLRYSFNTGSTLTTNKVVYIVADPQSDGKAKLASSPISQDLPETADGKIYIRLGIAYSEYQVQIENNHPIYFFKDGAIRLWTNASATFPAVTSSDNGKVLKVDSGAWTVDYDGLFIASYGSTTFNDIKTAYLNNKVVYCRASSNTDPASGSQLRMAFLAYVGTSTTAPTSFEFQYYRSVNTHTINQQGDQVFVYTINSSGTWSVVTREATAKIVAGTGLTGSYSNDVLTINGNLVTSISSTSTDTEYPSAKCMYDIIGDVETLLAAI